MGKPPFPLDTDVFAVGKASCRLVATNETAVAMEYLPDLKPETRYRLSFFLKTDDLRSPAGGGAHVVVNDGVNNSFPPRRSIAGTMDWTHFSFEFKTRPKKENCRSYIRLIVRGPCQGTAWFDGVRISEIGD